MLPGPGGSGLEEAVRLPGQDGGKDPPEQDWIRFRPARGYGGNARILPGGAPEQTVRERVLLRKEPQGGIRKEMEDRGRSEAEEDPGGGLNGVESEVAAEAATGYGIQPGFPGEDPSHDEDTLRHIPQLPGRGGPDLEGGYRPEFRLPRRTQAFGGPGLQLHRRPRKAGNAPEKEGNPDGDFETGGFTRIRDVQKARVLHHGKAPAEVQEAQRPRRQREARNELPGKDSLHGKGGEKVRASLRAGRIRGENLRPGRARGDEDQGTGGKALRKGRFRRQPDFPPEDEPGPREEAHDPVPADGTKEPRRRGTDPEDRKIRRQGTGHGDEALPSQRGPGSIPGRRPDQEGCRRLHREPARSRRFGPRVRGFLLCRGT